MTIASIQNPSAVERLPSVPLSAARSVPPYFSLHASNGSLNPTPTLEHFCTPSFLLTLLSYHGAELLRWAPFRLTPSFLLPCAAFEPGVGPSGGGAECSAGRARAGGPEARVRGAGTIDERTSQPMSADVASVRFSDLT